MQNKANSDILGVVLCGGQSLRMGEDKGLKAAGNSRWAGIVSCCLEQAGLSVVFSVNPAQVEEYGRVFPGVRVIADAIIAGIRGPLLGILSVHRGYPDKDLLVVACDMICMRPDGITRLVQPFRGKITLYRNSGGFYEPLCAIYPGRLLQTVLDKFHSGEWRKNSLQFFFKQFPLDALSLSDADAPALCSFNAPDELG